MLIKHVCLNALGSAKIKAQILDAQLAHVTLYPQKLEISAKQNKEYVSSSNPVDIKSPFTMKELKAGQENKLGKGQFFRETLSFNYICETTKCRFNTGV